MHKQIALTSLRNLRATVQRKLALARTSYRSRQDTVLELNNQLEALDLAIKLVSES